MREFSIRFVLPVTVALIANSILDLHHWLATGVAFGLTYAAGGASQYLTESRKENR